MRILGTLAAVAVVAGVAMADLPIPPPPPTKYLPKSIRVTVENELTGYTLYTRPFTHDEQSKIEPKKFAAVFGKAVPLPEWDGQEVMIYAVPDDLVPKLKTVKDWNEALVAKNSVVHTYGFTVRAEVLKTDERKKVDELFVITGVDQKKGIRIHGVEQPKPADKKEEKKPLALSEPGTLVGGIAVALGATLGGLWLIRRRK